ncbi:MAG TPA: dihydrodipicolinate synthase family protein [Acidobacteriota bacterium]|jgi:4-hydroxy-tetrahydrodipicolinate synthase|nr:dihydrodipicolinate synthase family protein [Acidobacteriota bacterium]
MKDRLGGVIVPIGTPVDENEQIDEQGLRRLVRHLIGAGVHAILANGSMGGFAHLEDREQLRSVEIILDETGGRVPVIANVGENGTRRVLRMARQFEKLGPDYLAVLPPFYFLMNQHELLGFYRDVLDGVQTPTFIYNNPATTKLDVEFETICELAQHPNAAGVKDSKQDCEKWLKMIRHFRGTNFSVCIGTEFLVAPALAMGCDGVIAGLHNVCPQIAVELYNSVCEGDLLRAARLQQHLIDLFSIFRVDGIWGGFEVALRHLGICQKMTVKPFEPITDPAAEDRIKQILNTHLAAGEELAKTSPRKKLTDARRTSPTIPS